MRVHLIAISTLTGAFRVTSNDADESVYLPAWTHNLLMDANVSGNLESFNKGLRGAPDHVIYDVQRHEFVRASTWHEYGVGFGEDLGVVPEEKPAFWMAEWPEPVQANLILLSGVYPNQRQPDTCWKIEVRRDGKWMTFARGEGGWYDSGRYVWGRSGTEPMTFDALRVSVFSKDDQTHLKSIHFRGEPGASWIVANIGPIDARIVLPRETVRVGQPARFSAVAIGGRVKSWRWRFGDGSVARGRQVRHAFRRTGEQHVQLTFSDGRHTETIFTSVVVAPPIEARIKPLTGPVKVGEAVQFSGQDSLGDVKRYRWDFGDGQAATGRRVRHAFGKPGIVRVTLTVSDGEYTDDCWAIIRVHTQDTLHVPQVFLDTDQKNEQDDQHYFGYALFSELDVLGINSVHHGGGQEPINYGEILHVLELAKESGLPENREPFVFHG
ncbi:MAG: PKD domain-containing protein [Armatimonadota bacterium]